MADLKKKRKRKFNSVCRGKTILMVKVCDGTWKLWASDIITGCIKYEFLNHVCQVLMSWFEPLMAAERQHKVLIVTLPSIQAPPVPPRPLYSCSLSLLWFGILLWTLVLIIFGLVTLFGKIYFHCSFSVLSLPLLLWMLFWQGLLLFFMTLCTVSKQ